jgi:hypothetical protein
MKIETLAVHAGYTPDPTTKAVAVPIYQTVAYAFDDTQHGADLFDLKVAGNIYSRIMNPTCGVLEARVAALEGGIGALAVASGMSAIAYAIQTITEAGDNIVSASTLYGGTYNLFAHTFGQMGIEVRFADYRDPASFAALIDERTKAIYCESVGNPLGNVTDLAALAKVAHAHGIPLIVDNTVPSPYLVPSVRAWRRHRGALDDQIPRRPWHHPGGHDCGLRQISLGGARPALQAPQRAGCQLPRCCVHAGAGRSGLHRSCPRGAFAQHGRCAQCHVRRSSCCKASKRWLCAWTGFATTP